MTGFLGVWLSRLFRRIVPDPLVLAIGLTVVAFLAALLWGRFPQVEGNKAVALIDAWRGDGGMWRFLAFGMQICLILVTGHALALTRPVRQLISYVSRVPRGTGSAAALIACIAGMCGLLNWGLGLIVGALLAKTVAQDLAKRGIPTHYPLLCAAGYSTMMIWHGGLSGSAPLTMSNRADAARILPPRIMEQLDAQAGAVAGPGVGPGVGDDVVFSGISLAETLGGSMNIFVTGGLLVLIPLVAMLLAPRRGDALQPVEAFHPGGLPEPETLLEPDELADVDDGTDGTRFSAAALDRSRIVVWVLAVMIIIGLGRYIMLSGAGSIGLNEINAAAMALGLILHGSARSYMHAVADGARGCAGILIQFPLYGGIMGMLVESGLARQVAEGFIAMGNETTIPILSFFAAGLVNLFIPSGGGQWAIQGPIALETALETGIPPAKMIMAVAYGDQLTNMLQPFWALPLLAITGVRARDIVGYTALLMLVGGAWMMLGLLLF